VEGNDARLLEDAAMPSSSLTGLGIAAIAMAPGRSCSRWACATAADSHRLGFCSATGGGRDDVS
jgi:hypothetical protein